MKIKTITCHRVYNFGASLQAYALMSYLKQLGHDVEIIDYMPPYIRKNLSLWAIGERWSRNLLIRCAFYCYVVPIRLLQAKSRAKFDTFTRDYMRLTRRYNTLEELRDDPPEADIYICGSDQIWNPNIGNGLDPAFYNDFAPMSSIRASYAASFSLSEIAAPHKHLIQRMLKSLDYISVRESSALTILRDMGIKRGVQVVDPVFLLHREEWLRMSYRPRYSNYILVYDQENSSTIKQIAKYLSRESGKKIVAFKDLYRRDYADHVEPYCGPIDFISLIAYADVVITNSFHCTAFSLILNRDFYVVARTHQRVNSRMADLLSEVEAPDRLVDSVESSQSVKTLNYNTIESKIGMIKESSFQYINRVLSQK
ncbi:MAG: polysaccharide pyruvyl transferase family protein [Rikenellaceae bacterium]